MRASQHNTLQQISVKVDIINFGCSIINQQLLWNSWTYYTPITRRRTRSLVENTNSIDIPDYRTTYYSFMLNLCRPFPLFKAGDNFQKKEEQVIIWIGVRLYFINYLLFHTWVYDHKNMLLVLKQGKVLSSFTMTERVILRRSSTGNALHIFKTDLSRKLRAIIKCTKSLFF